jgi:nitroreductase
MFTDTHADTVRVLEGAAEASLLAPSALNTQPWHWHISGEVMTLVAEPERQLAASDPDRRLLLISCGTALHHARTALAAAGWSVEVDRLPNPGKPDLLARLRLDGPVPPDHGVKLLADAIQHRRTDRRAFGDRPVAAETLTRLRRLVEAEGAYLHEVRTDQVPMLAVTAENAGHAELGDPAYRDELREWTNRLARSGDGVPTANAVAPALRRVPVRDLAPDGDAGLNAGDDIDKGAAYVVLFGTSDRPVDLLRAGEALSALLLQATSEGLATAPMSEAVEVLWTRTLMRELLAGVGEPYVAVRLGYVQGDPLPPTPRRDPADTITVES